MTEHYTLLYYHKNSSTLKYEATEALSSMLPASTIH